jgi:hypothetical protein
MAADGPISFWLRTRCRCKITRLRRGSLEQSEGVELERGKD